MKASLQIVADKILAAKSIAAFGHIKTDCDCVAGLLAFRQFCLALGKKIDLFVDSDFQDTLLHLPDLSVINSASKKQYDLLVSLDTATSDRLGKYRNQFLLHKNTVRIDHHDAENYAKLDYVDPTLPATCLMLKKLQRLLKVEDTDEINFLLLSGTMADTGCFKFESTNEETFLLAAELVKNINFNYTDAVAPLFQNISKRRRLLQARALENSQFYDNDQIALMFLSNNDLKEFNGSLADSSGMSHMVLDISSVRIAIAVTEGTKGAFNVTFYSKGNIDISVCARSFGGGGHSGAAGCKLFGSAKDILPKLVKEAQKALKSQGE